MNSIGLNLLMPSLCFLVLLRVTNAEHCMVYQADSYVLKQCGYGMPRMIGCLIHNQTVYLNEKKIIGDFMYGCREAGWKHLKLDMVESYIAGCVFQEKLLMINETTNLANYEMKCSEEAGGSGMIVSACLVNNQRIAVGEKRVFANRTEVWCRNNKGSISLENTACFKNGVLIPKGERHKDGRYEYVCRETDGSLSLDHEYCHYGVEQVAKLDERYVHEGTEYLCFNTGLEPQVYATGCIHKGEVVAAGKTVIIDGFLSLCKNNNYSHTEMQAIGCYSGDTLIPVDRRRIVGLVEFECRNLKTNLAQLVSVACLTHDGTTLAVNSNATIGAYQWTCRPDAVEGGSLHPELVQTACLMNGDIILPDQLYDYSLYQFKCVELVNEGKLSLRAIGCISEGIFTPFGQDMTMNGNIYTCEDPRNPKPMQTESNSGIQEKSEEKGGEIESEKTASNETDDMSIILDVEDK